MRLLIIFNLIMKEQSLKKSVESLIKVLNKKLDKKSLKILMNLLDISLNSF